MFDIGWDEMALIGVVSLIVIGPKDLPKVMREAGRWVARARAMASHFQDSLTEMARESDMADLKRDVEDAMNTHSIQADIEQAARLDGPTTRAEAYQAAQDTEAALGAEVAPGAETPVEAYNGDEPVVLQSPAVLDAMQHIPPKP